LWLTNGSDGIAALSTWRSTLSPSAFNLVFLAIVLVMLWLTVVVMQRLASARLARVARAAR